MEENKTDVAIILSMILFTVCGDVKKQLLHVLQKAKVLIDLTVSTSFLFPDGSPPTIAMTNLVLSE